MERFNILFSKEIVLIQFPPQKKEDILVFSSRSQFPPQPISVIWTEIVQDFLPPKRDLI